MRCRYEVATLQTRYTMLNVTIYIRENGSIFGSTVCVSLDVAIMAAWTLATLKTHALVGTLASKDNVVL